MRLTRLLLLIAGAALLLPGVGLAEDPQPYGPPPPPDPELVELVFSLIDANADGVLDPVEVHEWAMVAHAPGPEGEPAGLMLVEPGKWHMVPMPGEPPPGEETYYPPGDVPPPDDTDYPQSKWDGEGRPPDDTTAPPPDDEPPPPPPEDEPPPPPPE